MKARSIFKARDSKATMEFCTELATRGIDGAVAVSLYQVQYSSSRAKKYRRDGRQSSYARKNQVLSRVPHWLKASSIPFGWGHDRSTIAYPWVLYVDLPTGQCSFHNQSRGPGPDYLGKWIDDKPSFDVVMDYCDAVLLQKPERCLAMPFGAHAAVAISDLPQGYRTWLEGNRDLRVYLDRILNRGVPNEHCSTNDGR